MILFYNQKIEDVLDYFGLKDSSGLSHNEAKERLEKYGYNRLQGKKKKSFLSMFFAQFKSYMIVILLIAAVVSGVVGLMEGEGMADTFIILGILILNALIGATQEKKAESSLEALKHLAPPHTKVIRDGALLDIPSEELVPGDLVVLETGDMVPADIRLTEAVNLKIQESAMTGESVPVEKNTMLIEGDNVALGDRVNMAFSSGVVTYGRGSGIVVATGMQTEVGHIAQMLDQTDETETPMKIRLEKLGKVLGSAALIICAIIFVVGWLFHELPIIDMFMTAVSLAVAAIPEGLPAVSTIVLSIGVQRLVKQNAIIRTLPSVETLGSATVICSDKTGTLTQNRMTVMETYVNFLATPVDRTAVVDVDETRILLSDAVLCADARLVRHADGRSHELFGDPTETALIDIGLVFGFDKNVMEEASPRLAEIPFDSERKRMTTINRHDEAFRLYMKGGLDEVLECCNRIRIQGKIRPITAEDIDRIHAENERMASNALRVLAMAYEDYEAIPAAVTVEGVEHDLIYVGMLGMIDPARPEVKVAVSKCTTAGIRPIMITGDHKITALAIAKEIGIYREGDLAITGSELALIPDEEFERNVAQYSVYARVAPEHKVRIVKAWQKHDEVVAMTGDGVNDAPALKQADIGAAMGIVGTDVAKGAADMVLTDDNFATIVTAVEEGRRIYDNILKSILFLLASNVGEIVLLLITSLLNLGTPLLPIHLLWINLVTDSLPALALSVDPAEKGLMNRPPRNSKKGFMTRGMIWRICYQGLMIGLIPLVAYLIGRRDAPAMGLDPQQLGQTMAFIAIILAELIHVRNLHSNQYSSFRTNIFTNKWLLGAIILSAIMALIVVIVPSFAEVFGFAKMDSSHWILVCLLSLVPMVVVELFKLFGINGTKNDK